MKLLSTVEEAISKIQTGNRVFVHGGAATPKIALAELVRQAPRFKNVELIHLHTECNADHAKPEFRENFRIANLFVGGNMRKHLDYDRVDYLPLFLSEIPNLFRSQRRPLDVAIIQVSPPDKSGHCTLGVSVDIARAAVESAKIVIAQINPIMPRIHGDGVISINQIHFAFEAKEELFCAKNKSLSEIEIKIGKNAASLIEDGSTLQVGIGSIPDAVLAALSNHKNMGVHSEMWSDGMLNLIESGVVNNSLKKVHNGKSVSTFVMGSKRLYDFIDDNPSVIQLEADYVNNPAVIRRNPKVVAINSAVEIDLTGQICADSIGSHIISGVGGQMDFIRGASLSPGGKPIIALPSRTKSGQSRLVPNLKQGAGVVTTRAHVHFVVTEYGVADLYGKTLGERAKSLISISHPEDREMLEHGWSERFK